MSENEKIEQAGQADAAKSVPAKADKKAKDEKKSKPGFFKRVAKWFKEMKSELKKVVWPTWSQVLKNALTVVVCVLIVGVFIWIFDMGAKYGIQALLSLGK